MTAHFMSELPPVAMFKHSEAASETIVRDFIDAYRKVVESRRALAEARDTGFDYKEAFRDQVQAKLSFADHALEYARVLMDDDAD